MKKICFLLSFLLMSTFVISSQNIKAPLGRIAIVADGNSPDPDDLGGSAISIALLRAAGLEKRLVHYSHSCDLVRGSRISEKAEKERHALMQSCCDITARRFKGFESLIFYDAKWQKEETINDLRKAINASSEKDPLWIVEAGEPDIIGFALEAAQKDKLKFVKVITHHPANDNAGDFFKWQQILDFGVEEVRIPDQNTHLKVNISEWDWAKNHKDSRIQWLWLQGKIAEVDNVVKFQKGKWDCSDAGMILYWITGATNGGLQQGTVNDVKTILLDYVSKDQKNKIFRIDTHIHLYDTKRKSTSAFLHPIKHKKLIYPHLVSDFLKVASPNNVNYAVVIEASKKREDNDWAMEIVNKSDNMLAFIANLDPRDSNYIQDLEKFSKHKKFRGIRLRPKGKIDITNDTIIDLLGELSKRNLVLELRGNEGPVEAIEKIAKKYPRMHIIVNHFAGSKIKNDKIIPENWDERLEKLAFLQNVFIKISTLYSFSEETPATTDYKYYKPFIDVVLEKFGAKRLLFGSNWSLSEMQGSYANLIQVFNQYLKTNKIINSNQFYAENAIKAYGLTIKINNIK